MNILISHAYSKDNKGDAALLSVLIQDIRKTFHEAFITILTNDKIKEGEVFEGIPLKNGFLYYISDRYSNPLFQVIYSFLLTLITLGWAFTYRITGKSLPLPPHLKEIADLYRNADLIIPVGGGYIRASNDFRNTVILFFHLHPLFLAYLIRKPNINYAQSIGPFGNRFQEAMARFTLKRVTGIIARETITFELLHRWNIKNNTLLCVDSGFLFDSEDVKDIRKELDISKDQMLVGITTRNWLDKNRQEKYEKSIAGLLDYIVVKYNAAIVFIPQVTVENRNDDDRESNKSTYSYMREKRGVYVLTQRYKHGKIKAIYKNLDYLIGTRFHSVIFALTSFVPSIAIGYEYKTRGIMMDLGLESWVVDINDVDIKKLTSLFDSLVTTRGIYLYQLKKVLPAYIEKAKKSIVFVKETYNKVTQHS